MKKIIIMSVAVLTTLLNGEAMIAAVLGSIMVTGLLADNLLSDAARRFMECPVSALNENWGRSKTLSDEAGN